MTKCIRSVGNGKQFFCFCFRQSQYFTLLYIYTSIYNLYIYIYILTYKHIHFSKELFTQQHSAKCTRLTRNRRIIVCRCSKLFLFFSLHKCVCVLLLLFSIYLFFYHNYLFISIFVFPNRSQFSARSSGASQWIFRTKHNKMNNFVTLFFTAKSSISLAGLAFSLSPLFSYFVRCLCLHSSTRINIYFIIF